MAAPLFLARHAYVCHANEHLVFLDLRQDRYFCLSREQSLAVRPLLTERGVLEESEARSPESQLYVEAALRALVERGVLVRERAPVETIVCVGNEPPAKDMTSQNQPSPTVVNFEDVRKFFTATILASLHLRWGSLEKTIRGVERRKDAAKQTAVDRYKTLSERTATFHALRRYYPRDYLCLFDSLSLIEFLAQYRLFPQWIFGVTMEPFRAHCWIQDGSVILNDTIENVRNYTPIMRI